MCVCYVHTMFVFFFKQKTAYEMRISDWSSDVCSSDLLDAHMRHRAAQLEHMIGVEIGFAIVEFVAQIGNLGVKLFGDRGSEFGDQIGRASCRERVCQYV